MADGDGGFPPEHERRTPMLVPGGHGFPARGRPRMSRLQPLQPSQQWPPQQPVPQWQAPHAQVCCAGALACVRVCIRCACACARCVVGVVVCSWVRVCVLCVVFCAKEGATLTEARPPSGPRADVTILASSGSVHAIVAREFTAIVRSQPLSVEDGSSATADTPSSRPRQPNDVPVAGAAAQPPLPSSPPRPPPDDDPASRSRPLPPSSPPRPPPGDDPASRSRPLRPWFPRGRGGPMTHPPVPAVYMSQPFMARPPMLPPPRYVSTTSAPPPW